MITQTGPFDLSPTTEINMKQHPSSALDGARLTRWLALGLLALTVTLSALCLGATEVTENREADSNKDVEAVVESTNLDVESGRSANLAPDSLADGPLAPYIPFLGTWEINHQWKDGTPIWSLNEFEIGPGGKFIIARTFTRDGDGEVYERYHTYFSHDEEKGMVSHGFTYDGSVSIVEGIEAFEGKTGPGFTSYWSPGSAQIKQTVEILNADSYRWRVWTRTEDSQAWTQIMDGVWKRQDG